MHEYASIQECIWTDGYIYTVVHLCTRMKWYLDPHYKWQDFSRTPRSADGKANMRRRRTHAYYPFPFILAVYLIFTSWSPNYQLFPYVFHLSDYTACVCVYLFECVCMCVFCTVTMETASVIVKWRKYGTPVNQRNGGLFTV